jgi:hypothetical protein
MEHGARARPGIFLNSQFSIFNCVTLRHDLTLLRVMGGSQSAPLDHSVTLLSPASSV